MGHLGLTPQSVNRFGGCKVQGRGCRRGGGTCATRRGCCRRRAASRVVLECIPAKLAARSVSAELAIPTIGIGAGAGLRRPGAGLPRPAGPVRRPEAEIRQALRRTGAQVATEAVARWAADVRAGTFPGPEHSYADKADGAGKAPTRRPGRAAATAAPCGTARRTSEAAAHPPATCGNWTPCGAAGPLVLVPTMGALHEGHLEPGAPGCGPGAGRGLDLRQPHPVRAGRGLRGLPARPGPGPGPAGAPGAGGGLLSRRGDHVRGARRRDRAAGAPGRGPVRRGAPGPLRGRADGGGQALRPGAARSWPCSAARTPSSAWSSPRWCATSACRCAWWTRPRCARPTGWPCPRATAIWSAPRASGPCA